MLDTNIDHARDYFGQLRAIIEHVDLNAVNRVFQQLRTARDRGSRVFIAGNGGSSSTASHWVNDLSKNTKRSGRDPLQAMCLSDNASWLTALANDEGYDRVFAGQLENFARRDDLLIVITASGNSPNLVCAVEFARSAGVKTIGFLGFDGGILKNLVDDFIWVKTDKGQYELVEDAHMMLCHVLSTSLSKDRRPVPVEHVR
jgi:D-sedoheptulose 7-phosphate isomerase